MTHDARASADAAPPMPELAPGETRVITVRALLCRCVRCARTFIVFPRDLRRVPDPPQDCGRCETRRFDS